MRLGQQYRFPTDQKSLMNSSRPRRKFAIVFALSLSFLVAGGAWAQAVHPVTGRPIAPVMGAAGADWLDRSERQREENTDLAIRLLMLKPGMTVADIGAGTGYYSIRVAKQIGPSGRVLAVDIQPEMLQLLKANAHKAKLDNISTILGSESDPKLPERAVDLIIMVDVYHELGSPQAVVRRLRRSLRPDGRLVLLEYRQEDPNVPIRPEHKMSVSQVRAEIQPEGFRFVESVEKLPWQHMIFFAPTVN